MTNCSDSMIPIYKNLPTINFKFDGFDISIVPFIEPVAQKTDLRGKELQVTSDQRKASANFTERLPT